MTKKMEPSNIITLYVPQEFDDMMRKFVSGPSLPDALKIIIQENPVTEDDRRAFVAGLLSAMADTLNFPDLSAEIQALNVTRIQ